MSNKKSRKKHSAKSIADVTINDFANSTVCKNRSKKSNNVAIVLKKFETEKEWDEKDDELEGDFIATENEDGTISYVIRKATARPQRKSNKSECDSIEPTGNTYPIDIWFLISEYIQPEDVGRFAAICKGSLAVVMSAKFWFGLYKRYYVDTANLPAELKPDYMIRRYSLRASVIRMLHYVYPLFIERRKLIKVEDHPDVLKKMQCISVWYMRRSKHIIYYFKMQLKNKRMEKRDFLEALEDICINPDENCRILEITCDNYHAIPPILGLSLNHVSLTLAQGLRNHRLQLGFGSGVQTTDGGSWSNVVVLEPVINVKVLDWWHPHYPHCGNMEHLLNQE